MTLRIPFTKMHGSGNDFVVIDNRDAVVPVDLEREFARGVCRRALGIGADGVLLIETAREPDTHFHWRYINADGSDGEMCGNGAMCGARFATEHAIAPAECSFSTMSGPVHAQVTSRGAVAIDLVPSSPVTDVQIGGQQFTAMTIGVPHVVTVVPDADAMEDFDSWGRAVRYAEEVQPAGTNANAISLIDAHTIRMRTWERGVEAETLACGTGSAASAIAAARMGMVQQPISVRTTGGPSIVVEFSWQGDCATQIRIIGETRIVGSGVVFEDAWR